MKSKNQLSKELNEETQFMRGVWSFMLEAHGQLERSKFADGFNVKDFNDFLSAVSSVCLEMKEHNHFENS